MRFPLATLAALLLWIGALAAQAPSSLGTTLFESIAHPAIGYGAEPDDPIARLMARLRRGEETLATDSPQGPLPALLRELDIPVESQIAVFSQTSLQRGVISAANPRTIFFNDSVIVAWPRGGFIEMAAHDRRGGVNFYALTSQPGAPITRPTACLRCHYTYDALGVPGLLARSIVTSPRGVMPQLGNYVTDDRSPLAERWAGWYVTGSSGRSRHLGNQLASPDAAADPVPAATNVPSLASLVNTDGYLTPHSDIVALLVFDHETRMVNLLSRAGWEVRLAQADRPAEAPRVIRDVARELTDALLFVDEAPLAGPIQGSSRFASVFSARGPRDRRGRSLRDFDLKTRMMRYPCSFMIYTEAFSALPEGLKDAVYRRLGEVLSGAEQSPRYRRLSAADRRAVLEILRETGGPFSTW